MLLKLIPDNTKIKFMNKRWIAFACSATILIGTLILVSTRGLNFGIDFSGGILIEARFEQQPDLASIRNLLKDKPIGDVSLQTFGDDRNLLIRIGEQSGHEAERLAAVNIVKGALESDYKNIEYRKVDYVGPKVGAELIKDGIIALILSFAAMLVYIWFRFEWQYGVSGIVALIHDVVATIGFFSITQLSFDLTSIATLLTIVGYSINDTVVIFDRVRENLRKYKSMGIVELLDLSVNETLARTIVTSLTTVLALIALVAFAGETVRSFSMATLFGVLIGTFSTFYVASPLLIYMNLRREKSTDGNNN